MVKRSTALRLVALGVIAAALGWVLFTCWQYRGFTWMVSAPHAVHVKGELYIISRGSPVSSLGSDRCTDIRTIPISWKPVRMCHGDRPSYVVIEWDAGQYYIYTDAGPSNFWNPTSW